MPAWNFRSLDEISLRDRVRTGSADRQSPFWAKSNACSTAEAEPEVPVVGRDWAGAAHEVAK